MKAIELAKTLLEHPDREVFIIADDMNAGSDSYAPLDTVIVEPLAANESLVWMLGSSSRMCGSEPISVAVR